MPTKYSKLETVRYHMAEEPDCAAVFLCAVDTPDGLREIVAQFDGLQWYSMDDGEPVRGTVFGFIGPIERLPGRRTESLYDV